MRSPEKSRNQIIPSSRTLRRWTVFAILLVLLSMVFIRPNLRSQFLNVTSADETTAATSRQPSAILAQSNSSFHGLFIPDVAAATLPTANSSNHLEHSRITIGEADATVDENQTTHLEQKHPHAGARSTDGQLGYIANPLSLKMGIEEFRIHHGGNMSKQALYWRRLNEYEAQHRNSTYSRGEILKPEFVCGLGPGRGIEQEAGYKILSEKIKVNLKNSSARILCAIYTYDGMRDLARAQALTWGHECDGFLAFSTETIPSLGMVNLSHQGREEYGNMWQKVRSIWAYLHDHYIDDYDFFHLGGDDLFLIVDNLRSFLSSVQSKSSPDDPLFLGQWSRQPDDTYIVTGGPGYTLNPSALKQLVANIFPHCFVNHAVSWEDKLVSKCFWKSGIRGSDTREKKTGEQQYHGTTPAQLYLSKATSLRRGTYHAHNLFYWESLPHPDTIRHPNETVGRRSKLDAAAQTSVSFHDIHSPLYVARVKSLLFPETCPPNTPLGRNLKQQ